MLSEPKAPKINIERLGIVSRNYERKYGNGHRDFSYVMPALLSLLDERQCDAALFSLYLVIPRTDFDITSILSQLRNIKALFLEEFVDDEPRRVSRYLVYHKGVEGWQKYEFHQQFATITGMSRNEVLGFVASELPKRILGNCAVLICGESNGVKYFKSDKEIHDTFRMAASIPSNVSIILNPVHDRMTRFEMNMKRAFLSKNMRWVVSVWNKGKRDKNGTIKDGTDPAWTVYHNGVKIPVVSISNNLDVEIGILDASTRQP